MISESNRSIYLKICDRGNEIFLTPSPLYRYDDIINGVKVGSKSMKAVDKNTFMAFGYFDSNMRRVMQIYNDYFLNNKDEILSKLNEIMSKESYLAFEEEIYRQIYSELRSMTDSKCLDSYNRIRKPINLYMEHIVAMAGEVSNRQNLVPFLLLPMDKYIFASPHIFTEAELAEFGVRRKSGFGDVKTKPAYMRLQEIVAEKAAAVGELIGRQFHPIYFDLFWRDRYLSPGRNLFETNLRYKGQQTPSMNISKDVVKITSCNIAESNDKTRTIEYADVRSALSTAPRFLAKYEKSGRQLQKVFDSLIMKCRTFCPKCFPTNKPDFRLQKTYNFCLITFANSKAKIHIRTDGLSLKSELLLIKPLPNHHYNGWEWVQIEIDKESEVDEASRLIEQAYRNAD